MACLSSFKTHYASNFHNKITAPIKQCLAVPIRAALPAGPSAQAGLSWHHTVKAILPWAGSPSPAKGAAQIRSVPGAELGAKTTQKSVFPLSKYGGGGTWEVETACLPPPQILNVGELLLYPLISTPDGVTHSQRHTSSAQGSLPAGPGDPLGCQRHSPGGLSAKKCPPHCAYLSLDAPFCRFMCKIVPLGSM